MSKKRASKRMLRFQQLEKRDMLSVVVDLVGRRDIYIRDVETFPADNDQVAVFATSPNFLCVASTTGVSAPGFGIWAPQPFVVVPWAQRSGSDLKVFMGNGDELVVLGDPTTLPGTPGMFALSSGNVGTLGTPPGVETKVYDDVFVQLGSGNDAVVTNFLTVRGELKVTTGTATAGMNTWGNNFNLEDLIADEGIVAFNTTVRDDVSLKTGNGNDGVLLGSGPVLDPLATLRELPGITTRDELEIKTDWGDDNVGVVNSFAEEMEIETEMGNDSVGVVNSSAEKMEIETGMGDDNLMLSAAIADKIAADLGRGNDDVEVEGTIVDKLSLYGGKDFDSVFGLYTGGNTIRRKLKLRQFEAVIG